jgi:multicomponent K+:H+ antiporter subunit D
LNFWLQHLPSFPIVVPLVAGAALLLFPESRRKLRAAVALIATTIQLAAAITLMYLTTDAVPHIWPQGIGAYAIGGWAAPYGIVLVVDRLSALMLTVNAVLALAALVYSLALWDRLGVHYHTLLQLLLLGLNGAFLTGDLFNLFVFFEILLAASYALVLHGGGTQRVKMALHFIVVNLAASFAFLIGVAVIYGVVGTLNMADIAARWPSLTGSDRSIAQAGAAILGIAFLVKAGAWPLNFWLPGTYAAAGAPVAAVFAISTKVGVYAMLRLVSLLEDPSAPFGGMWLFGGAIATIVFGIAGVLASRQLARVVAFTVVVSSGTLLAAIALPAPAMTAAALYYLLGSVLGSGAFFMLTGMTDRIRTAPPITQDSPVATPATYAAFAVGEPPDPHSPADEVGVVIPAAMAFLGLAFVCCALLVTGMPPLAGFLAKLAMLSAAFTAGSAGAGWQAALLIAAVLGGGLAGLVALMRSGMRLFWSVTGRTTPRLRIIEAGPLAFLILLCLGLTVAAGPTMAYLDSAARILDDPQFYIRAVLGDPQGIAP